MTSLYEQLLYTTKKEYQLYFDKLWISNREVRPGDGSGILSSALSNYKEIELDYNKNNLFIEFATSNYVSNNDFQYEYKLVGLDDTWLPAHSTTIDVYKRQKVCSFDCIYCECGFNADHRPSKPLPTREEIREALETRLKDMLVNGPFPDVLTFAGNGEPTAHPHFPEIIEAVSYTHLDVYKRQPIHSYQYIMNELKRGYWLIISYLSICINTLLIKCKVKNFMDINRVISAEKYV